MLDSDLLGLSHGRGADLGLTPQTPAKTKLTDGARRATSNAVAPMTVGGAEGELEECVRIALGSLNSAIVGYWRRGLR